MTALDLDAIKTRVNKLHRAHIMGASREDSVSTYSEARDDIRTLVAEVERQAEIIESFKQMWVEWSAAPTGEAAPCSSVASEIRSRLNSEWPAERTSDSSSTGSES